MGSATRPTPNPLAAGFYTVPDAARLIEVGNAQRIHGWLRGYPRSVVGPLMKRDFAPIDEQEELSFLDLMEVRAIEYFRANGVKARTLRRAIEEARDILKTDHPFATAHITFRADEKFIYIDEVLERSAKEEKDSLLYNLIRRSYESYTLIKETIGRGVEFDPRTHLPKTWRPRSEKFPNIVIDPLVSYGRPALPSGIATTTLFDAWLAEGKDYDEVAYWFEVPTTDVERAVAFEQEIARAA
ncbi:MAG: hypothetical protein RIM84_08405 [Alphaproteobacteria bacterium]